MTDRAAWLERRRSGVGASDVAGILGISPWESPYSIWLSKVLPGQPEKDPTDAMDFGRRAEAMLGEWFEDRNPGLYVRGEQTECHHPDHMWMSCTVDGFVFESSTDDISAALGIVEFKTSADSAAEWAEHIPDYYATQATWTLAVTGMERAWFGVLHLAWGRPEFRTYVFERDEDDESFVVGRCTAFWHEYVLTGIAPPVDDHEATTRAIKAQWPTAEGSIDADDKARVLVRDLRTSKAMSKAFESRIATAENELRVLLGEHEALVDGVTDRGKPNVLASWKGQERTSIDVDKLRTAYPDLAREFTRTTTTRVLRVKPTKED